MKNISLGSVGLMLAGFVCTACPNPNNYTTPRTAPAGKISHSVAAEYWGYSAEAGDGTDFSGGIPTFPTYSLRVGIADRFEIAGRVANLSSLGADFKWNFLRSDSFDAAIDPGFQWFSVSASADSGDESASSTSSVVHLHAPILLGFNFNETVSLVASPGVTYSWVSTDVTTTDERDAASTTDGLMGRLGVGFDFRISPRFAIHPQVTFLRTFEEESALLYMAGIGFNFGNLPSFGAGEGAAARD